MTPLPPEEVLAAINTIPSLPAVVTELLAQLDDDHVDMACVARRIAVDPALTARVLRLANSSFYGLQKQITTPSEALAVLGLHNLRRLISTAAIMGKLPIEQDSAIAFEAYWRHAIGTALCARGIAAQKGINPESAYVAGLLHDIGRLVLAIRFPERYKGAMEHHRACGIPMVEAEDTVLGLNHAMVGAALARHWNFPEPIRQAIAEHHDVDRLPLATLVAVVHAADALAHALDFDGTENAMAAPIPQGTWDRLELHEEQVRAVADQADQEFALACRVLQ